MKFKDSSLAHKYLDGLDGVEIGGSAHNPFHIAGCRNIDYTASMETVFKLEEVKVCGEAMQVDIVADGAHLPLEDGSQDYVLSSHVLEHFRDPIGCLKEWMRVLKPGGYIFAIIPHCDRTFDKGRPITSAVELFERHMGKIADPKTDAHHNVWRMEDFLDLADLMELVVVDSQDPDDKVGNGFTVVMRKGDG